ncbi:DUF998 domain-containing protein [Miniphocaeibacter massiliensis]|uniref:DUF998 domain-containing protein n=1 Tax=Miniphocaeibacter massiliensis TaxID=2041841 RepID=UPI000C1BBC7A|nr:DUF998 domain-containing protein [Miniphocaeibacter massiliensis]
MFLKKYGFYFMIIAILSELILPFILGSFIIDFSHTKTLISRLGEAEGIIKIIFKIWEIINGLLFFMSIPAFFERFKKVSEKLAKCLCFTIILFGLGDCILTGLFDSSMMDFGYIKIGKLIHGSSAFIAYIGILVGVLLLIKLYMLEGNRDMAIAIMVLFIITGVFMLLFAAPKISMLKSITINYRGLWQKLALLFAFSPFLLVSINEVISRKIQ